MSMPSPAHMASITADAAVFLTEPCTIERAGAPVSNGIGGTIPGAPVTVATVLCRYQAITRGRLLQVAERLKIDAAWSITLPKGTAARVHDEIAITGTSRRFRVREVATGGSTIQAVLTTVCEELL